MQHGLRNVTAGANPMGLKKGIEKAVAAAVESIKSQATNVEDKEQAALLKLYEADRKGVEELNKTTEGYQKQIDALTMTEDAIMGKERAWLHDILTDRLAAHRRHHEGRRRG